MAGKCSVPHEKFPFWNLCWTQSFQALSSAGEASPRNWRIIQPSNWLPSLITNPDYQRSLSPLSGLSMFIYVYAIISHIFPIYKWIVMMFAQVSGVFQQKSHCRVLRQAAMLVPKVR